MSAKKKHPKIERTSGPYPTNRFGIRFTTLSKSQKRLLIENPLLKERCKSDAFALILFEQNSYSVSRLSSTNKLFYDWSTGEIIQKEDLIENYNTIDWICALSGNPIKAKMSDFSLENFVHPDYHDALKAPMVDSRILKSSVEFRKKCKELLLNQQQEFLNLVKKGKKS